MGKRSNFLRRKNDAYDTPPEAVEPLLARLPYETLFIEPCAGSGKLVKALQTEGHICLDAFDIEPRYAGARECDARSIFSADEAAACFITNPPWTWELLSPIIGHLSAMLPTWLLLDAGLAHTKRFQKEHLSYCREIVSVGRVRWIPGSPHTSKDDAAWYLFDQTKPYPTAHPIFVGRAA